VRFALCNEVIRDLDFAAQCDFAASVGYDGLELAPFTLGEAPHRLGERDARALRRAACDAGIAITGLHWLLVAPAGLSITSADERVRRTTIDVARRLVDLCAALGGRVMVHGSPQQRRLDAADPDGGRRRGEESFARIAEHAQAAGVTYCIEPLAREETDFVTTVAEAAAIVTRIGNPALRTMVDARAAALAEALPVAELLDRWLPTGMVQHVHVNDRSKLGPGQGQDRFAAVLASLGRHAYGGVVAVEPFEYRPDGAAAAARAIGYLRGLREALAFVPDVEAAPPAGEAPGRRTPANP
jgi:D-psicose/D-tagatose/L-ribulose 3-epimerase